MCYPHLSQRSSRIVSRNTHPSQLTVGFQYKPYIPFSDQSLSKTSIAFIADLSTRINQLGRGFLFHSEVLTWINTGSICLPRKTKKNVRFRRLACQDHHCAKGTYGAFILKRGALIYIRCVSENCGLRYKPNEIKLILILLENWFREKHPKRMEKDTRQNTSYVTSKQNGTHRFCRDKQRGFFGRIC